MCMFISTAQCIMLLVCAALGANQQHSTPVCWWLCWCTQCGDAWRQDAHGLGAVLGVSQASKPCGDTETVVCLFVACMRSFACGRVSEPRCGQAGCGRMSWRLAFRCLLCHLCTVQHHQQQHQQSHAIVAGVRAACMCTCRGDSGEVGRV